MLGREFKTNVDATNMRPQLIKIIHTKFTTEDVTIVAVTRKGKIMIRAPSLRFFLN